MEGKGGGGGFPGVGGGRMVGGWWWRGAGDWKGRRTRMQGECMRRALCANTIHGPLPFVVCKPWIRPTRRLDPRTTRHLVEPEGSLGCA